MNDGMNAVGWHVQVTGEAVDADAERFHELLAKDLAWMDWIEQVRFLDHRLSQR